MTRWRWMVEDCSACTLMMSLPALMKSSAQPGSLVWEQGLLAAMTQQRHQECSPI